MRETSEEGTPYPTTPSKTRIGWIDIGVMGGAKATRLISAGYSVTIFARTPSKATHVLSLGSAFFTSPADVARSSDIVFTMLGHPHDFRKIILDTDNNVLSGLSPNSVLVDHTSSEPGLAKLIFGAARKKGCWSVDAPVSGGDVGAKNGELVIFAGRDYNVVRWSMPVLEIVGRNVRYMGGVRSGQSCKIGNQIMVGENMLGLSEGLVFAGRVGLDKEKWMKAVRGGAAGSMVMDFFEKRMIDGDFRLGGFIEYTVKDLGLGVDFVEDEGDRDDGDGGVVVSSCAALGKQLFFGMVANGDGNLGTQGLVSF